MVGVGTVGGSWVIIAEYLLEDGGGGHRAEAEGGAPLLLLELQQRDSEESCSDVAPGNQSLDNGDQTQHTEQTIQHPLNTFRYYVNDEETSWPYFRVKLS